MTEKKKTYLTEDGLEELKKELEYLKTEKRPEVINALKEARALGDLSENAEYDAARTEQAEVENKISEIEAMLENAELIKDVNTNKVSIGTTVTLKYVEDDETDTYTIVGSKEADPFANKISNESPLAKAIIGAKKGQYVMVDSPNGKYQVEILEIS
ncbi:MAG: transcription elongation factor GreA [Tenericutes bacterium]|nr:transcription elongation factor GreA [Mycoplasmatota bacterium]